MLNELHPMKDKKLKEVFPFLVFFEKIEDVGNLMGEGLGNIGNVIGDTARGAGDVVGSTAREAGERLNLIEHDANA